MVFGLDIFIAEDIFKYVIYAEFDMWYSKCFLQQGEAETSASAGFGVRPGINVPARLLLHSGQENVEDDQVDTIFMSHLAH